MASPIINLRVLLILLIFKCLGIKIKYCAISLTGSAVFDRELSHATWDIHLAFIRASLGNSLLYNPEFALQIADQYIYNPRLFYKV